MSKKSNRWLLNLIWTLNGLLLLGVLFILGRQFHVDEMPPPPSAAAAAAETLSPPSLPPTATPFQPQAATSTPGPPTRTPVLPPPSPTPPDLSAFFAGRPRIIGYSVEKRPLEVYRFGQGADIRLIVAGIHGGSEWNTIALADELIQYLQTHPETVPPDKTLFILRNLNPDGAARARGVDGRVNAHGVDLNRNWPYRWKSDWNRDGCWQYRPVTAGAYPASEPETTALMTFIQTWRPSALISYHSAALGVFAGGVPDFPPSMRLAERLAQAGGYQYPPIDTGCDYTGNLTDWASSVMGIPAVDIELTNHHDTDFEQNLRVLRAFLDY